MRQTIILTLAVMAMAGAIVAWLATEQQMRFDLRGYENPVTTSDLPYRVPRFGVNVDLRQYDDTSLAMQLRMMQDLGVHWVRQPVDMASPASDAWSQWLEIWHAVASTNALEPIAVMLCPADKPGWNTNDYIAWLDDFSKQFAAEIDYYQICDEPNIALSWPDPNPSAYAALLAESYSVIRVNDPDSTILAAALAPTTETGPENVSDIIYFEELLRLGVGQYIDAFAAKPYGFATDPSDREVAQDHLNFSRIVAMRELLREYDLHHIPLWASNWGWNALPRDWTGRPSIWGDVTEAQQSQYTREALSRAEREWPWLAGMIIQHWQPAAPLDDPIWGFSLLDPSGQPRSIYGTLQQHLESHPSQHYATNGIYPAQNAYTTYHGAWTFSALGADIGWLQDSQAQFHFSGTDIALITRESDANANLFVSIDGQPANALPQDAGGNAYLLLRSDTGQTKIRTIRVGANLEDEAHMLTISADETVPDETQLRWPLVGFAVSSGDLRAPYTQQIRIAQIIAMISTIAVGFAAARINWRIPSVLITRLTSQFNSLWQNIITAVTTIAMMLGMLVTWNEGVPQVFRRDSVQIVLSLATAGLLYINQWGLVIAVFCAAVLLIFFYHRPQLGLILTVIWSPLFLFPVELYLYAFPMVEVLLWLTVVAMILRWLAQTGILRQTTPGIVSHGIVDLHKSLTWLDTLMLIWLLLGCLAVLNSSRPSVAITEFRTLFLQPALFYWLLRQTTDKHTVNQLVFALISAALIVSTIGLFMWIRGDVIEAEGGVRRLVSVYGSPNNVALFLMRAIPFIFAALLVSKRRGISLPGIGIYGVLALTMSALVLTQSAGAIFLALPAGLSVMLVSKYGRRAVAVIPILALAVVVSFFIASQSPRFSRFTDLTEGTNFYRLRVWESTLNMVADSPLLGVGLDQFLYEYRDTYMLPDAWREPDLSHPHNIILDFWSRLGIGGVVWLVFLVWRLWRVFSHASAHEESVLMIGTAGAWASLLTHGLVDNSIFVIDLAYVFALLMAISAYLENMRAIDAQLERVV